MFFGLRQRRAVDGLPTPPEMTSPSKMPAAQLPHVSSPFGHWFEALIQSRTISGASVPSS